MVYSFGESREISGNFSLFFLDTLSVFLAPSVPKSLNKDASLGSPGIYFYLRVYAYMLLCQSQCNRLSDADPQCLCGITVLDGDTKVVGAINVEEGLVFTLFDGR